MININMRCIEIQAQRILDNPLARININMRCIEIDVGIMDNNDAPRLTLT